MIADLKPYPAVKDSGVPWLREVPDHWEMRKLKHAVSFAGGGTPSKARRHIEQATKAVDGLWVAAHPERAKLEALSRRLTGDAPAPRG